MSKQSFLAIALSLAPLPAAASWPYDHLDVVDEMVAEILPANNEYASPSTVYWQNGVLHVSAVCGGFVAEVLTATYDGLDAEVMSALFDDDPDDAQPWASPDSTHYYRAFLEERVVFAGGGIYALKRRDAVDDIRAGDLLVSEYFEYGMTGHTMIVRRVDGPVRVTSKIPGFAALDRYRVQVIDATATVHMNKAGTTDTRYMTDIDPLTGAPTNDRGVGRGDIHVFADPTTGAAVGWSWAVNQSIPYQGVDPTPAAGAGKYRPILAGRIVGPGL